MPPPIRTLVSVRPRTVMAVALVAVALSACSSAPSTTTSSSAPTGGAPQITPAMSATKTVCPEPVDCFTSGNVSTVAGGVPGLFKGAWVGADAYLAYRNYLGGLDGRRFKLITADDDLSCATNKAQTQALVSQVMAFTGSFSLYDNCGGQVLAQNPEVPDVSVTLDPTTAALPNVFSVQPSSGMTTLGPYQWFSTHYPQAVKKVGTLVADAGTAPGQWQVLEKLLDRSGYDVVYQREFSPFESDFTADVVKMEQAGVKMVLLFATNDSYGAKLLADMHAQGFHPQVVWGGPSIYSGTDADHPTIVTESGGPAVADGLYLEQAESLYLGEDETRVPEIRTFLDWVHGLYPNFNVDLYTLYGWASAQLYVDALSKAGPNPTQSSLLAALHTETSFDAGGMLAPADPAGKKPPTCWLLAQVKDGRFRRVDMPATAEYRCDGTVVSNSG